MGVFREGANSTQLFDAALQMKVVRNFQAVARRQYWCQPGVPTSHQRCMFRHLSLSVLALALVTIAACTTKDNPDEIRRRTAEATESVRRDTKAVVEGVKEGMGRDNKAININKASREDLLTLPGISEHEADHIIAERPYDDTRDLVRRHVLPQAEYDKISDRVIADR